MFYKAFVATLLWVTVFMVCPGFAVQPSDLESMSMDDLVRLEDRLGRILKIRKLEAQIKSTEEKGVPAKTEKKSKRAFGMDSTQALPQNSLPTNTPTVPTVTVPPKPVLSPPKPRKMKTVQRAVVLPKIVAIKGEIGSLTAHLEIEKGILPVSEGDKILSGRYTVTSIRSNGVTVKSGSGKTTALTFKPFDRVETTTMSPVVNMPAPKTFGSNSVYVPPLPSNSKE